MAHRFKYDDKAECTVCEECGYVWSELPYRKCTITKPMTPERSNYNSNLQQISKKLVEAQLTIRFLTTEIEYINNQLTHLLELKEGAYVKRCVATLYKRIKRLEGALKENKVGTLYHLSDFKDRLGVYGDLEGYNER